MAWTMNQNSQPYLQGRETIRIRKNRTAVDLPSAQSPKCRIHAEGIRTKLPDCLTRLKAVQMALKLMGVYERSGW